MASVINTIKNGSDINGFQGIWEDVQWYSTVKINVNSPVSGEVKLRWANPPRGRLPTDERDLIHTTDISCIVTFDGNNDPIPLTFERDTIARWFRLDFCAVSTIENSLNIEVLYKRAPTSIKLIDTSENQVVNVDNGNLYTVLVDSQGDVLRSTSTPTGEALFTNWRDASGVAVLTASGQGLPQSLSVALRDNCSNEDLVSNFDSLGIKGKSNVNALYVHTSDVCGNSQAGGYPVTGANVAGVPLYLTLTPDSTKRTSHMNYTEPEANALYVFTMDKDQAPHNTTNPIVVSQTTDLTEVFSFDISSSVKETWRTHSSLKGVVNNQRARSLHNLYAYNDGPTLVWLRVYDLSVTDDAVTPNVASYDIAPYIMQTIPLGPGQTHDTNYPRGLQFNNGIAFRATVEPYANSTKGPGDNVVFVAGTYTNARISSDMAASILSGWGSEENRLYSHHQSQAISPLALAVTRDPVTIDGVWTFRWTQPSQYVGSNSYTLSVDASEGTLPNILGIEDVESFQITTDTSASTATSGMALINSAQYTTIRVTNTGSIGDFYGTWIPEADASSYYFSMVKDDFELFGDLSDNHSMVDGSGYLRFSCSIGDVGYITTSGDGGDLSFCAISGEFGNYVYMTVSAEWTLNDTSITLTTTVGNGNVIYNIGDISLTEPVVTSPFNGSRYTCIMKSIAAD